MNSRRFTSSVLFILFFAVAAQAQDDPQLAAALGDAYMAMGDSKGAKAGTIEVFHADSLAGPMAALKKAFEAKNAGVAAEANMKKMAIDWVTFEGKRMSYRSKQKGEHYRLVVEAMRAKLEQNPKVRAILLATGDLVLRPDHIEEPDAPPEWHYYTIWMEIRNGLRHAR